MEKTISYGGNGMLIGEVIDSFLFHCQYEKNLNLKTIKAYRTDLIQFAAYMESSLQKRDVDVLQKEDIKNYLQEISPLKPKTVKRKIASLKAMFNFMEYENDYFMNPFRRIRVRFKEPYTLPTVMNMNEIKRMIRIVYQEKERMVNMERYAFRAAVRNVAVVELLFATGIRVSELCSLRPEDVDLRNGKIKVFGKGSKERVIQICQAEVLRALREYYRLFSPTIKNRFFFFINRLGSPLSPQSVRLMVRGYSQKAGISKRVTPHTLRHRILSFGLRVSKLQEIFS